MSSTINAQTTPFAAIVQTADNTGNLAFQTANVTALTIDTSQNVGIGETSPSSYGKLTVTDAAGGNIVLRYSGNSGYAKLSTNSTNDLIFGTHVGGSEKMRLDQSGNLGLGVTPSTWTSGKAIEVQTLGNAIWGNGSQNIRMTQNMYYNSGYKYANTGYATYYSQNTGEHQWYTAPSGTAGTAISFTQAMTLDASGNLTVGTTGGTKRITAYAAADNPLQLIQDHGTSSAYGIEFYTYRSASPYVVSSVQASHGSSYTNPYFVINVADTSKVLQERMRIDSSGNLGIGTTSPSYKLDVVGGTIRSSASINPYLALTTTGSSTTDYIQADSNGVDIWASSTRRVTLSTNGTERMRVDSSGRVTTPYQPAFLAYRNANTSIAAGTNTLPYDSTGWNIGSCYNTSTYRFTAPVAGVYQFNLNANAYSNLGISRILLKVNGTEYVSGTMLNATISGDNNFSFSVSLQLSANDYVNPCLYVSNSGCNISGGLYWSNFTGYLVG